MYAIIDEGGGQRKVQQGDEVVVDLINGGDVVAGAGVTFDRVLLLGGDGAARIGTPYLAGAAVTAEVVDPVVMGDKIHIYKHREKKTYKRKTGHRQRYTSVRITGITG